MKVTLCGNNEQFPRLEICCQSCIHKGVTINFGRGRSKKWQNLTHTFCDSPYTAGIPLKIDRLTPTGFCSPPSPVINGHFLKMVNLECIRE